MGAGALVATTAPASVSPAPVRELQLVCFRMSGEEFALGIMRVREIVRPLRIVRVPKAPSFVEGVINLRGEILPVVDLRRRLGLPRDTDERRMRFLVVGLERSAVVFVVDEVTEVVRVPREALLPAPPLVRGLAGSPAGLRAGDPDADCLIGVLPIGERLVMLLHPERVLSAAEARELRDIALDAASSAPEAPHGDHPASATLSRTPHGPPDSVDVPSSGLDEGHGQAVRRLRPEGSVESPPGADTPAGGPGRERVAGGMGDAGPNVLEPAAPAAAAADREAEPASREE